MARRDRTANGDDARTRVVPTPDPAELRRLGFGGLVINAIERQGVSLRVRALALSVSRSSGGLDVRQMAADWSNGKIADGPTAKGRLADFRSALQIILDCLDLIEDSMAAHPGSVVAAPDSASGRARVF